MLGLLLALPSRDRSRAADPVNYTVTIEKTGNGALDAALSASSSLVSLRTQAPAGPFALVARARDDVGRFQTALQAYGYYAATVAIRIDNHPVDDPGLPDLLAAAPENPPAAVGVAITPGPLFHLRRVEVTGDVSPSVRALVDPLKPGSPAIAADVLAARNRLLDGLRRAGHPLAKVAEPVATLVAGADEMDVSYAADPGPFADLGPISLDGLKVTNPSFVRRRLLIHQGEPFNPDAIDKARNDLMDTGIFSAVDVKSANQLDAAGQLPLAIDFEERARRALAFTALYSTDLGGSLGVNWTLRNVFGNAEQLNLKAAATQLGGTATTGVGYDIGAGLTIPDWQRRNQTLDLTVEGIKEHLPAYDRTAVVAGGTVTRKLTPDWTASVGLLGTREQVLQEGQTFHYELLQVPLNVKFDNTGSLLDPVHGVRASVSAVPTHSFGTPSSTFGIFSVAGSTYLDAGAGLGFDKPGRSVLALRGLFGTVPGVTSLEIPPDARFYAGGSSTVRGFRYQTLGPRFPDQVPVGGTYIATATAEWRQRILSSYGFVAFVDTGTVNAPGTPYGGRSGVGAGVGARYYTPFGPIRADVAVPVTRRHGDDALEVYIGLGQAF